jgi:hypothetical protein
MPQLKMVLYWPLLRLAANYRIDENKNKAMKNNNLNELTYDTTRKKVTTTRGAELEIKNK